MHIRNRTDLITKGMAANNDGIHPAWNGLGNSLENDGLSEDRATEDITDLDRTQHRPLWDGCRGS